MQNSVIFQKRMLKGLTLKAAAKKIGCSHVILSMLEKGDITHPNIAKRVKDFYKLTDEEYYQLIPKNYRPGKDYDPDKYKELVPDISKGRRRGFVF